MHMFSIIGPCEKTHAHFSEIKYKQEPSMFLFLFLFVCLFFCLGFFFFFNYVVKTSERAGKELINLSREVVSSSVSSG